MISIYAKDVKKLMDNDFKADITKQATELERNLKKITVSTVWQQNYINKIIEKREELLTAFPGALEKLKTDFDTITTGIDFKDYKDFREQLVAAMGYTRLRDHFYPKYFNKTGIKACVYCNALLTVAVDADEFKVGRKDGTYVRAKFQVDHFIAKDQYPCFSVSLFNLYPVCGPCNNIKSTAKVKFQLYNEDENIKNVSLYEFRLKPGCVADYLSAKLDRTKLEFSFEDPDKPDKAIFGEGSLADTFDIAGIYATQLDVIEELVLRRQVYNDAYKQVLLNGFPELLNKTGLSDRVLLGNYADPEDIHKRPLAKFMQDIDLSIKNND